MLVLARMLTLMRVLTPLLILMRVLTLMLLLQPEECRAYGAGMEALAEAFLARLPPDTPDETQVHPSPDAHACGSVGFLTWCGAAGRCPRALCSD